MKKSAVFTIISASIAVIVLLAVLIIGINYKGFGLGELVMWDDDSNYSESYQYTRDLEDIEGLDVEWINGPVDVRPYDGDVIAITEYSRGELDENQKLSLSVSYGVLKIKWNDSLVSFGIFHNTAKKLLVEVPRQLAMQMSSIRCANTSGEISVDGFSAMEMSFDSTSGDIMASNLNAEKKIEANNTSGEIVFEKLVSGELLADTVSGSVDAQELNAEEAKFSAVSGEISARGRFTKVETKSVSGDIYLRTEEKPQEIKISTVSGESKLTLPQDAGFEIEYSSISGYIHSDFAISGDISKHNGSVLCGDGSLKISFESTSGDLSIGK